MTQSADYKQQDVAGNYLVINHHVSGDQVVKRVEEILIKYLKKDLKLDLWELETNNCVWDDEGRVRIDITRGIESEIVVETTKAHAALWTILSDVYVRFKGRQPHIISTRDIYHKYKHKMRQFPSKQATDRYVSSLVIYISLKTILKTK